MAGDFEPQCAQVVGDATGYMVCQVVSCVEGNRFVPVSMDEYKAPVDAGYRDRFSIAAASGEDQSGAPDLEAAALPPALGWDVTELVPVMDGGLAAMNGAMVLQVPVVVDAGPVEPAPGNWEPAPGTWLVEDDAADGGGCAGEVERATSSRRFMQPWLRRSLILYGGCKRDSSPSCSKHVFCPDGPAEERWRQPSGEPFREPSPAARRQLRACASAAARRAAGSSVPEEDAADTTAGSSTQGASRSLNGSSSGASEEERGGACASQGKLVPASLQQRDSVAGTPAGEGFEGQALEAWRWGGSPAPASAPPSSLPGRCVLRERPREAWNSTLTSLCLDAARPRAAATSSGAAPAAPPRPGARAAAANAGR